MREFIQKPLALFLSASLLCAYSPFALAAERIVVDNGQTYPVAHEEITGLHNPTQWGGAIYNKNGILKVEDVIFSTNIGYSGGAITASTANMNETSVVNARFENNHAVYDGGAIGNFSAITISGSKFIDNTAQLAVNADGEYTEVAKDDTPIGGGAISFGAVSASKVASIEDTLFQNNISGTNGGAIATRNAKHANNSAATLDISATFDGNKAYENGGAIYNTFYTNNGLGKGDGVTVTGKFTNNQAGKNGGAIYNDGAIDKAGNAGGVMTITDATFTDNTAKQKGGAIYNDGTMTVSGSFTGNKAVHGGAIYNANTLAVENDTVFENNMANVEGSAIANYGEKLTIGNNVSFKNNTSFLDGYEYKGASEMGALYTEGTASRKNTVTIGDNVSFQDNKAYAGAGLYLFGNNAVVIGDKASFSNNSAQTSATDTTPLGGGGAISLVNWASNGSSELTIGNDARFENNTALYAGAINVNTKEGKLTIGKNASFTGNKANGNIGGAIYNKGTASIATGASFEGNSALAGGAVFNDGTFTMEDVSFTDNISTDKGGALYNRGTLTLSGANTFSGNLAGGTANDIYNIGTLNIANGTTTLEGGIMGTGTVNVASGAVLDIGLSNIENDTVTFANGSTLGVTLASDQMGGIKANTISVGESEADQAKLLVTLSKDFLTDTTGVTKQLTNGTEVSNGTFALADVTNALYNVSFDAETNEVTAVRKSQEEQNAAITAAGGNSNTANVINAFTSASDLGSDAANQAANIINQLAQTDTAAAVTAAKALAPEEASAKQVVYASAAQQLFSAIDTHINTAFASAPRTYALANESQSLYNSGKNYSVWAQGLLNKSHKEETSASAFTGRSTGLAGGADIKLTEDWIAGLGYAYLHTNVDSLNRHSRILGDNFFLYGQYRPGRFFVQGAFTYGDSKYEEDKYLPGLTVDADYHVKSYAANLSTGYELTEWLTPLLGVRYMNLQQESYTDSSDQSVSASQNNYLTGTLGAKLSQEYRLGGVRLLPQINAGLAYDFVSDSNDSTVALPNGAAYDVNGERLHRLAFEAGVSVSALLCDQVEIALGYDGNFRQDYNAHTGNLKLRYMF